MNKEETLRLVGYASDRQVYMKKEIVEEIGKLTMITRNSKDK